jgi:hypothetical protein
VHREVHPPKRSGPGKGGTRKGRGAAGSGTSLAKLAKLLLGAVSKNGITQLQVERNLRGKRSDPSHGANAQPKAAAVPVVKVPVRNADVVGVPVPVGRANHRQVAPNPA